MRSRLNRITDWAERARAAKYRAEKLAVICGVSSRQLRRFIHGRMGCSPHKWLNELRQTRAALYLLDGPRSIKEVSYELGYSQACHLSRDFKRFHGVPPSRLHGP
jgi:transcriptional regulator GlxA family with amidase domain